MFLLPFRLCVIPSVAEGPRIFLGARHIDFIRGHIRKASWNSDPHPPRADARRPLPDRERPEPELLGFASPQRSKVICAEKNSGSLGYARDDTQGR